MWRGVDVDPAGPERELHLKTLIASTERRKSMPNQPEGSTRAPSILRPRRTVLIVLGLVVLGLSAAQTLLPQMARTFVIPLVRNTLGVAHFEADIRRLNLRGVDLGQVNLGPAAGVRLKAAQIDWTLPGLLRKRLKSVQLLGLEVEFQEGTNGWTVPGLPAGTTAADSAPAVTLPHIDSVVVEGRINLNGRALRLELPLALNGTLAGAEHAAFTLQTFLAGQPVSLDLSGSYARKSLRISGNLPPAPLAALLSLLPDLDLPVSGALTTKAEITADCGRADLTLENVQTIVAGQTVTQAGSTTLSAQWNGSQVTLSNTSLHLLKPWPVEIELHDILFDPAAEQFFACSWSLRMGPPPKLELTQPLACNGSLAAGRGDGGIKLAITGSSTAFKIAAQGLTANITELKLSANLALGGAEGLHGNASLTGGRLAGKYNTTSFSTTALAASLHFAQNGSIVKAGVQGSGQLADSDLSARFNLNLPLAWPAPAQEAGSLSGELSWQKKGMATFTTDLKQNFAGMTVAGRLSLLPLAVQADLKGAIDFHQPLTSHLEIKTAQTVTLPAALARFNPSLGEVTGSARLDLNSRVDFNRGVPRAPFKLTLNDVNLYNERSKITLTGGRLAFAGADALQLRSDPDQHFSFALLQLGSIRLEKGDVHFQMEKPAGFLVEGCSLRWAGGRIGTHAFRINPSVEDYRVELFCDRVQLAQALEQFGLTQVQGGGSANGRIPLHYANGLLTFDNGFLYSTPGEKGILKVKGTEILTAGVAPGSAQFGQLDLAAEALKDFAYEWAKIGLNTQGRELVVALELDGKPARPLPFVYDETIGGFARVTAASPGSAFQGINLNVNFRLPLDQLLRYRSILELINKGG